MQKFFHPYNRKIWLVFILTLLIGIFIFPKLPEEIPVHFDVSGHADSYGSRWTIFLAPGINFAMIFLAESLRKIDPKSGTYKKFEPHYYNIHFIIALLMMGIQLMTIFYTFGYEINVSRIMPLMMGLLFIFLGNMMPKFKPNYFVGIKTSWTLASERVWYMTHRLAGKVWVIGGLFAVFLVFLPTRAIVWAFIIILAFLVLIPVLASLYFYQKYEK
jgi:uncharacterized membrane protein